MQPNFNRFQSGLRSTHRSHLVAFEFRLPGSDLVALRVEDFGLDERVLQNVDRALKNVNTSPKSGSKWSDVHKKQHQTHTSFLLTSSPNCLIERCQGSDCSQNYRMAEAERGQLDLVVSAASRPDYFDIQSWHFCVISWAMSCHSRRGMWRLFQTTWYSHLPVRGVGSWWEGRPHLDVSVVLETCRFVRDHWKKKPS